MKSKGLWICTVAALAVAVALAGCGTTYYVAGRSLPPSGEQYRVLVAIQNPNAIESGELEVMDAYYDEKSTYNGTQRAIFISGYSGSLPLTIQNMPEEQEGAVYGAGDGSFALINYQKENELGNVSGLGGLSSSIFITRSQNFVFAANQESHVLTVVNRTANTSVALGLPDVYRVSVNPGGTVAMAFVQDSNYAYYARQLTTAQSVQYSGGPSSWPKAAVDCEPQNGPSWCLFQVQSPDAIDSTGNYYGAPLVFDRPVKAVFSADGSIAYILNCGPECGGNKSSVSLLPTAPMVFTPGEQSGLFPCNTAPCANSKAAPITNIPLPGGASNALVDTSTMYVVGQEPEQISGQTLFGGHLTVVNLANNTASAPVSISDGLPGALSRMVEGDDNTLWIGMTGCITGVRAATDAPSGFGCLTMYNTASKTVTLEPYLGNDTGIAAITGLHKIYTAEGGQVYIYSTVNGSAIDNQFVTVTGTASDVAYMDAVSDADNTVY